jgi:hypothetical protein
MVFIDNEDYSDLYGGGRNKRKRGSFEDYGSEDEDYSNKKRQVDEYDAQEAQWRSKVISKEFMKRRSAQTSTSNNNNDEDNLLAESTLIKDSFNKKILNLSIKTRENSFKKLLEYCLENRNFCESSIKDENEDEKCQNLCIDIEFEIFDKAKNLILYQSNLIKKLSELKRFTKEKKSFIKDYETKKSKELQEMNIDLENNDLKEETKEFKKEMISNGGGFTSALNIFNNKNVEIEKHEIKTEANDSIIVLDNSTESIESKDIKTKSENFFKEEKVEFKVNNLQETSLNVNKKTLSKEEAANLQIISKKVVTELTIYYKNGRFLNKVGFLLVIFEF